MNIGKLKSLDWAPRISVIDGFNRSVSSEIEALVSKWCGQWYVFIGAQVQ